MRVVNGIGTLGLATSIVLSVALAGCRAGDMGVDDDGPTAPDESGAEESGGNGGTGGLGGKAGAPDAALSSTMAVDASIRDPDSEATPDTPAPDTAAAVSSDARGTDLPPALTGIGCKDAKLCDDFESYAAGAAPAGWSVSVGKGASLTVSTTKA